LTHDTKTGGTTRSIGPSDRKETGRTFAISSGGITQSQKASDRLAELHCPGNPPPETVRLIPKRITTDLKEISLFKIQSAVMEYDSLRFTGVPAIAARAMATEKYGWPCDESTFNKQRKRFTNA
jgi:hypothetical protein